ncbi:MAG: hypothetical protein HS111_06885 [Kofleriaceae bacterium]|nr:hypothetical protein [Kofleriaceae bacterium]
MNLQRHVALHAHAAIGSPPGGSDGCGGSKSEPLITYLFEKPGVLARESTRTLTFLSGRPDSACLALVDTVVDREARPHRRPRRRPAKAVDDHDDDHDVELVDHDDHRLDDHRERFDELVDQVIDVHKSSNARARDVPIMSRSLRARGGSIGQRARVAHVAVARDHPRNIASAAAGVDPGSRSRIAGSIPRQRALRA